MKKEEKLFTVSCVNCNNQVFQFSRNLLENIKGTNKDICGKIDFKTWNAEHPVSPSA